MYEGTGVQRLSGRVQHYAWGSRGAIPRILGAAPDGQPWAEYWLGAHSSAPSQLDDGELLDAHLAAHPREIGQDVDTAPQDADAATQAATLPGGRLPYLMKILSAAHSLSLQAHPSRAQAQAGFAAENAAGVPLDAPQRLFRDDWPKPEMIVALTDFEALSGFRDPAESLALIDSLAPTGELEQILEPLRTGPAAAGIEAVLRACLSGSQVIRNAVADLVASARRVRDDGLLGRLAITAAELDDDHQGDPSILAALLMNRVVLHPGEQIHQPAGTIHAYLRGTGIEIMANSDNVMRGGLTGKHIDVDALLRIADLEPGPVTPAGPREVSPGVGVYDTPYPEFRLWRITPQAEVELPASGDGRILLVIDGELACGDWAGTATVGPGQSLWLPAGDLVRAHADAPGALAFLAGPGASVASP